MEVVRSVVWPFGLRIIRSSPDDDSKTPPAGDTLIPPTEGIPQGILKQVQHDNTGQPTLTHWGSGYPFFIDLLDIM